MRGEARKGRPCEATLIRWEVSERQLSNTAILFLNCTLDCCFGDPREGNKDHLFALWTGGIAVGSRELWGASAVQYSVPQYSIVFIVLQCFNEK